MMDGSVSIPKSPADQVHIEINKVDESLATRSPDLLTRLPLEILIHIFGCLDTSGSFQALIASRQVSRVCQIAVEHTTDYRFLADSVRRIQRDLGSERARSCLVYFRKRDYSRKVLRRSLRLAYTFQHIQSKEQHNDQAFRSLPIEWLLTQPSPATRSK